MPSNEKKQTDEQKEVSYKQCKDKTDKEKEINLQEFSTTHP